MENGDSRQRGDLNTERSPHRAGMDQREGQGAPHGIGRSIRPGVPVPETVLVVVMSDGSYLLVGYPHSEPVAFVVGEEAELLRQGLAGAFGTPQDEAARGNGNSHGTVVPGNGALHVEKAQA